MATFPSLVPSTREYEPGSYPMAEHVAMSGEESRVRLSSAPIGDALRVTFIDLTYAQMLSIVNHYKGESGTWKSFSVPAEIWNGADNVNDYLAQGSAWKYVQGTEPEIYDYPCGGHDVTVTLESVTGEGVEPIGVVISLVTSIVAERGAASGDKSITLTTSILVDAGAAPGTSVTITTSITATPGTGGISAVAPSRIVFLFTQISTDPPMTDRNRLIKINTSIASTVGGPTPWTPAAIAPDLWFDASALTTLIQPDGSSQWNDISGNAGHIRIGAGVAPTVSVNAINGLNAILFDGVDDRLESINNLSSPGPESITIISVFKVVTGGSNDDVFMGTRDLSFTSGSFRSLSRQSGQTTLGFYGFNNNAPISTLDLDVGGGYHIFGGWNTALTGTDNVRLMKDGTVVTGTTSGPLVRHGSSTSFIVGQLAGGLESNLSVPEIVVIYSAVTDTTRQKIEGYLAHKYALTGNLPAGHPYKTVRPFL